jgi:preprotein translocase subunit SecD
MMEKLTGENVGRKMAIVLDEKITSAPVIESKIGERGRITMGGYGDPFKLQQEVKDLVGVLRSGALPAPLKKSFETQVGATMGRTPSTRPRSPWASAPWRSSCSCSSTTASGNHREPGHDPQHALHDRHPGGLRGVADLARHRGPGAHHRHGGGLEHHHLRAHPRGIAPGQVAAHGGGRGFQRAFWTVFDAHVTNFVAGIVLYSYGSGPHPRVRRDLARRHRHQPAHLGVDLALDVRRSGEPPRDGPATLSI